MLTSSISILPSGPLAIFRDDSKLADYMRWQAENLRIDTLAEVPPGNSKVKSYHFPVLCLLVILSFCIVRSLEAEGRLYVRSICVYVSVLCLFMFSFGSVAEMNRYLSKSKKFSCRSLSLTF